MSCDDLVLINVKIMKEVLENVKKYVLNSYIIVLSNLVDVMIYVCYKIIGFFKNRVIG